MPVSVLIRGKGAVKAPIGLIVGIPTNASIPSYWATYNRAQDYFIRGTTSNSLVNTVAAGGSITLYSTTDNLHIGSAARDAEIGYTGACTTSCHSPSLLTTGAGSHGSHSLGFSFRPNGVRLRLIYAYSVYSYLYPGMIMFSTNSLPHQISFTDFDSAGSRLLLSHATKTEYYDVGVTPNALSGEINDSHIHTTAVNRQVYYLKSNNWTTVGSGGGTHSHSIPKPLIWNYNPKYVTLRSYRISDIYNPVGLIGMWPYTAAPPSGWELVSEVNDRFIKFASTYSAGGGNDTIEIGGMLGSKVHSHPYGSSTTISRAVSPSYHYNDVDHLHYYSHSAYPFTPLRLYLKFIRYVGL